jgi:hypothetical protein
MDLEHVPQQNVSCATSPLGCHVQSTNTEKGSRTQTTLLLAPCLFQRCATLSYESSDVNTRKMLKVQVALSLASATFTGCTRFSSSSTQPQERTRVQLPSGCTARCLMEQVP